METLLQHLFEKFCVLVPQALSAAIKLKNILYLNLLALQLNLVCKLKHPWLLGQAQVLSKLRVVGGCQCRSE